MKKTPEYIKCPRCELNYILKKDKYCEVCKSEMRAGALEDEDLDDFDEDMRLCPVCHTNYINDDETMCASCLEEKMSIGAKEEEPDWRSFVEKEASEENEEELDLLPIEENDEGTRWLWGCIPASDAYHG